MIIIQSKLTIILEISGYDSWIKSITSQMTLFSMSFIKNHQISSNTLQVPVFLPDFPPLSWHTYMSGCVNKYINMKYDIFLYLTWQISDMTWHFTISNLLLCITIVTNIKHTNRHGQNFKKIKIPQTKITFWSILFSSL